VHTRTKNSLSSPKTRDSNCISGYVEASRFISLQQTNCLHQWTIFSSHVTTLGQQERYQQRHSPTDAAPAWSPSHTHLMQWLSHCWSCLQCDSAPPLCMHDRYCSQNLFTLWGVTMGKFVIALQKGCSGGAHSRDAVPCHSNMMHSLLQPTTAHVLGLLFRYTTCWL
jgi:hypothetical protein